MVWLIAGLPATAVVAGITTYFIATHDPDTLVGKDYQKEGMTVVDGSLAAMDRATALGLSANLSRSGEQMRLRVSVGKAALPDTLLLELRHATKSNQDRTVTLSRTGEGIYNAPWHDLGAGKRQLALEPQDHSWRLEGEWLEPFSEETRLRGSIPHSSTHP
ncbi:MAG: FixH family protein [Betaproteobacteria bacterium]|nr:FixH family protein [Betaproteobacteria bacterium]